MKVHEAIHGIIRPHLSLIEGVALLLGLRSVARRSDLIRARIHDALDRDFVVNVTL